MSRGIVFFGINNSRVNYLQLAGIAARFAKHHLKVPTCIITDTASLEQYPAAKNEFDIIRLVEDTPQLFQNVRKYKDTQYYSFDDTFKNETRSQVYELTPFDETLLVDCDYLICGDTLNAVWGCAEDVLINKDAHLLNHTPMGGNEYRLNDYGIRMYWATVIYFKKSAQAKLLFDLVQHIKENWDFYKLIYDFPGNLFRNDFAFSIAIHILSGNTESELFKRLPYSSLTTATDLDQLYKVKSPNEILMFHNDRKETWKFQAVLLKGIDVHCMNKLSILNQSENILKVFQ